jgi:hypothetical protein
MPDLKINVDVTGAQKGAADMNALASATTKTAQAAEKTAPANQKAATATKSLGDALSGLGSRNNDAKDVLEGVSAAAKGGEGALFGVAKAARAAFAVFASGPIGIAVAGLALLGTTALALADKFRPVKKSAEELAKEVEAATKRVEELGRAEMSLLRDNLKLAAEEADRARKSFDLAAAAKERLENAEKAARAAEIRSSDLSDEARARALTALDREFAEKANAAKIEKAKNEVKLAGEGEGDAVKADETVAESQARALEKDQIASAAELRLEEIKREQTELQNRLKFGTFEGTSSDDTVARLSELAAQRKLAESTLAAAAPEESAKALEIANANRAETLAKVQEARRNKAAAEEVLKVESDTQAKEKQFKQRETRATDRASSSDIKKRAEVLGKKAEEAAAAGDSIAQNEAVAERNRLLKEASATENLTPAQRAKVDIIAPKGKPGEQFVTARDLLKGPNRINRGSELLDSGNEAAQIGRGNRINKGADFEEAAQEIKDTPPLDAAPITQPVKEVSEAVKAQADQSQANVQAAGSEVAALVAQVGPPLDLTPLTQAVVQLDGARGQQIAAMKTQIDEQSAQIRMLAYQVQSQAAARA